MTKTETGKGLSVAFDAKRVFHNFTGLGNYSRTLLHHLHEFYPDFEFHLFTPSDSNHLRSKYFLDHPNFQIHESGAWPGSLWRSFRIGREIEKLQIPIYHGLSQELPFSSRPTFRKIVSVHDLIFRHFPNHYSFLDRHIYDLKVRRACQCADQVVAISEATKRDIIRAYGISEEKVHVIYQTCADHFWAEANPEEDVKRRSSYALPKEYILYVGSVIKRKNLLLVIEGMSLLPKSRRPHLLVVGKGGQYLQRVREKIRELNLEERVSFLPDFPFSDFPILYRGAIFSVYPSSYEGFGIPLLESIASGTPVLTTKKSSLPEAAGPGGHYLEEEHPLAMAEALDLMLSDASYLKKLGRAGKLYAQKFSGRKLAGQWIKLYRSLS